MGLLMGIGGCRTELQADALSQLVNLIPPRNIVSPVCTVHLQLPISDNFFIY